MGFGELPECCAKISQVSSEETLGCEIAVPFVCLLDFVLEVGHEAVKQELDSLSSKDSGTKGGALSD